MTRRELLEALPALFVLGCRKAEALPETCDEVTLSSDDLATRRTLGYVDHTPYDDEKSCSACAQFVAPPDANACGGCKLLKGPIHPRGYCKAFAAKS